MVLRAILHDWLQNAAQARVREAVVQAAKGQLAQPAPPPAEEPKPCHLGVVFALGIEAGCFEDLLEGAVTIRGNGFRLREGGLHGRRVVLIVSGPGRENARRATELLIDGHRPGLVVSAGFAGGLSPQLKRNDILVADRVMQASIKPRPVVAPSTAVTLTTPSGATTGRGFMEDGLPIDVPAGLSAAVGQGVHHGLLLTLDHVVRSPAERQALLDHFAALAVDMETFAVAEVCRQRQTAFASVRVINDVAGETLPRDVEHLLRQKTGAARLGAALGAVCRRPASLKGMYQLHENALVASGRLAQFLADFLHP